MQKTVALVCLLASCVQWTLGAEECHFNQYINTKVVSDYSAVLLSITNMTDCLAYLKDNKITHKVVAFEARTKKCCAVLQALQYQVISEPGWITFELRNSSSSLPSTTSPATTRMAITGYAMITSSGSFTVPTGVYNIKVLAIGGGAGGARDHGGGGGSGYVAYAVLNVTANQVISVTIGTGGGSATSGTSTVFGNSLLVANGGTVQQICPGSPGGSGGGSGCAFNPGGSGGSGGSNGTVGGSAYAPGAGQGSSFTSDFGQFQMNTLSAGPGGAGITSPSGYTQTQGGGGGGGVLINRNGPYSGATNCNINGVWSGPGQARGYGAGGSAGCMKNGAWTDGGRGVDGLVYLEY